MSNPSKLNMTFCFSTDSIAILSLPTLRPAINQRLHGLGLIVIHKADERGIHPASCFNRVQPADDEMELRIVFRVFVLDFAVKPM